MQLTIRAIGQLKKGPEKVLVDHYQQRLHPKVTLQEFISRKPLSGPLLKTHEGELLLQDFPLQAVGIALDEKGELWSSQEFARYIEILQGQSIREVIFCIGGADGLSETVLSRCQYRLALGRMTWPHLLVRGLLMEQLYRCQQILANHPYHRS